MTENNTPPPIDELLSALMDGEIQELELHRLLKTASGNAELRAKWARYNMASSLLREGHAGVFSGSLRMAEAVQHAISTSQAAAAGYHGEHKHSASRRQFARFAVAASVSCLVVLGGQWYQQNAESGRPQVVSSGSASAALASQVSPRGMQAGRIDAVTPPQPSVLVSQHLMSGSQRYASPVRGISLDSYLQLRRELAPADSRQHQTPFARVADEKD